METTNMTRFFRFESKGQPKWLNPAHIIYASREEKGIEVFLTGDTQEGSLLISEERNMERFIEFMDWQSDR